MGDDVRLFAQSITLRSTQDGEIFGAEPGKPLPSSSYTTPGHGDFFQAIKDSGVLAGLKKQGVTTIMFSNVDNLGATVDPVVIGHFLQKRDAGVKMLAETVERTPEDGAKTGTAVRADGLFRILEGFRIPDDVAKNVPLPEVSINTFYFDVDALTQHVPLDWHAVKKKVDGKEAIQFETVTCEATGSLGADGKPLLPLAVVRMPREGALGRFRDGRFYPVKTPEDLDRVRDLLRESPVYGAADVNGAGDKAARLARLDAQMQARFGDDPHTVGPLRSFSSPGRINLIGEHVDYQDGLALPAAVHLGVLVDAKARDDGDVVLHSLDLDEPVRFSLSSPSLEGDTTWGRYAKAVVRAFDEKGVKLKGLSAVLGSSLPPGSGMSSSSALSLALVKAFASFAGAQLTNKEMVLLAQRAEHIVGVHCGNMDQSAIVNGKKDHAVLLDCKTLEAKSVPLRLGDWAIVVGNTKKPRGLVDSEYNKRREECEGAVTALKPLVGRPIESLRDVTPDDLKKHGAALSPKQRKRAEHVVEELARVRAFVAELEKGGADVAQRVGPILDETHRSLRDKFEVSCKELDAMVELSRAFGGGAACAGARMMGGGFGGCTLSLVRKDQLDGFLRDVGRDYEKRTGLKPELYVVEPDDGLTEIAR
jgi:galactokinase